MPKKMKHKKAALRPLFKPLLLRDYLALLTM